MKIKITDLPGDQKSEKILELQYIPFSRITPGYYFFYICRNVKRDVIHAYGMNDLHNTYVNLSKSVGYMIMG
jgi:hypothetical protein